MQEQLPGQQIDLVWKEIALQLLVETAPVPVVIAMWESYASRNEP